MEDRRKDDITITKIFHFDYINRFHFAVGLWSNRSQMTSKCGKNIKDTLGCASCATFCSFYSLISSVIYY